MWKTFRMISRLIGKPPLPKICQFCSKIFYFFVQYIESQFFSAFLLQFTQKFFRPSRSCIKLFVSVVLFKRLDYFIISSVDCQQLIWIFWKLFYFSVFQKQFLATACLLYHCRKESSSTFYKKVYIFLFKLFVESCRTLFLAF